jgi:hypothetical protein
MWMVEIKKRLRHEGEFASKRGERNFSDDVGGCGPKT